MDVRKDFPVLEKHPGLVYLDSACTSLKPREVIEAESRYYSELGACGGRSSHSLGRKTSEAVDMAREKVASFVGASGDETVWMRNATEALNTVVLGMDYSKRRKVVTSAMEHHSVLLPLLRLRDEGRISLGIARPDPEGVVGNDEWGRLIGRDTALVVTHSWNNSTGTGNDVRTIARMAHDNGALVCIDGAQGVPHHRTDFRGSGIDFLAFSGHKMLGPTGIGALVAKKERLEGLDSRIFGGGTVRTVGLEKVVPLGGYERMEAGVQDYAGILGLAAACGYLKKTGMDKVEAHERRLAELLLAELKSAGAHVYGRPGPEEHGALYSFNIEGAKPHDIALMLDRDGIALRSGFFCAQVAMESMGAGNGAVRASAYIYNSEEDVKKFGASLRKIIALFK